MGSCRRQDVSTPLEQAEADIIKEFGVKQSRRLTLVQATNLPAWNLRAPLRKDRTCLRQCRRKLPDLMQSFVLVGNRKRCSARPREWSRTTRFSVARAETAATWTVRARRADTAPRPQPTEGENEQDGHGKKEKAPEKRFQPHSHDFTLFESSRR